MSVGRSVGRSVGPSVRPSHFTFFAFLGILRVGKSVFEHAPAQIITAPAQVITAPAQPPATGAVVYTALFYLSTIHTTNCTRRINRDLPGEIAALAHEVLDDSVESAAFVMQRLTGFGHSFVTSAQSTKILRRPEIEQSSGSKNVCVCVCTCILEKLFK